MIIKNKSSFSDKAALLRVLAVVEQGLISENRFGEHYCCCTTFVDCVIYADLTKSGTHVFEIHRRVDHA